MLGRVLRRGDGDVGDAGRLGVEIGGHALGSVNAGTGGIFANVDCAAKRVDVKGF